LIITLRAFRIVARTHGLAPLVFQHHADLVALLLELQRPGDGLLARLAGEGKRAMCHGHAAVEIGCGFIQRGEIGRGGGAQLGRVHLGDALLQLQQPDLLRVFLGESFDDQHLLAFEHVLAVAMQDIEGLLFHACVFLLVKRAWSVSKVCGSGVFSAIGWRRNSIRRG
jgi:hypothetical protein